MHVVEIHWYKTAEKCETPSKLIPTRLCSAKLLDDLQWSIALHRQSRNFAPDFLYTAVCLPLQSSPGEKDLEDQVGSLTQTLVPHIRSAISFRWHVFKLRESMWKHKWSCQHVFTLQAAHQYPGGQRQMTKISTKTTWVLRCYIRKSKWILGGIRTKWVPPWIESKHTTQDMTAVQWISSALIQNHSRVSIGFCKTRVYGPSRLSLGQAFKQMLSKGITINSCQCSLRSLLDIIHCKFNSLVKWCEMSCCNILGCYHIDTNINVWGVYSIQ